ncbi:unnamed protein product [Mytilus edulis]|uniref:Spindle and kinetochore-associated protein 3 n=1 Tax=Mytilus edulis TaxID=6550 RepID=A0A8S3T060_MYTED|nr:unnamed protein product [Mytilus edulis]
MADSNTKFFSKLKTVCKNIEQGISQLQSEVETKTSSRSSGKTVMKLTSLKQEIQDMKIEGRQKCQTLDLEGKKFNELMECCRSLLDIQNHKLHNIEIFMNQYGYRDYTSKESKAEKQVENIDENDEMKENQKPLTPHQETKPDRTRTPKAEDFGFSSYTLRAMERGFSTIQQEQPQIRVVPHLEARIPSLFNTDDFVSLTPSVFGRHVPFNTPGKYQDASPSFHDFFTPADKRKNPEQLYGSDFPKLNLNNNMNMTSPEAPVFQTPGMKHFGQKDHFERTGPAISTINNLNKAPMNSPQLPVFQSESARKLMENGSKPQMDVKIKSSRAKLYDDLPQTPEFTVNLKNIVDTDNEMPKEFKPLAERLGHDITSNITPPMPEMFSDRHSKLNNECKQQIRDLSKTPPAPKFLSSYANNLVHKK